MQTRRLCLPWDGCQCGRKLLLSYIGKMQQLGDCEKVLPEDFLLCGQGLISLPQLISVDAVFTAGLRLLVVSDNPVSLVEEVP